MPDDLDLFWEELRIIVATWVLSWAVTLIPKSPRCFAALKHLENGAAAIHAISD